MLKADMEDRNGGPPQYSAWREYAIIAFIIGLFVAGGAFFYWGKDMLPALQQLTQNTPAALPETAPDPLLAKLYERYEMEALPATLSKKSRYPATSQSFSASLVTGTSPMISL